ERVVLVEAMAPIRIVQVNEASQTVARHVSPVSGNVGDCIKRIEWTGFVRHACGPRTAADESCIPVCAEDDAVEVVDPERDSMLIAVGRDSPFAAVLAPGAGSIGTGPLGCPPKRVVCERVEDRRVGSEARTRHARDPTQPIVLDLSHRGDSVIPCEDYLADHPPEDIIVREELRTGGALTGHTQVPEDVKIMYSDVVSVR